MTAAGFHDDDAALLGSAGFVVLDGWLSQAPALALRTELLELLDQGRFTDAGVGRGAQRQHAPAVRSDRTLWFHNDDADLGPGLRGFLLRLQGLRVGLNRSCFLGLSRIESHAAVYEPGARYAAHVDAFDDGRAPTPDARTRVISFSYYLNEGFTPDDGGCLRLHGLPSGAPVVDVEPLFDRLVLFQSRTVLHEVLPVMRRRFSITGWLS